MDSSQPTWLVFNEASGSNDEPALAELDATLADAGFAIERRICFPDEPAPDACALDNAGVETLCVFAGDGTIHSVVTGLFGWRGRIVVLPGGTMNLLSKRLHGDVEAAEILARIGAGRGRTVRPPILEGRHGYALTGALAGPGAQWSEVREAMRSATVGELASGAVTAVSDSIRAERVVCRGLEDGRDEGYAAISITPEEGGIEVRGYYADRIADYIGQLAALLGGDFRDGPHDTLGSFPEIEIASLDEQPMGLLMDGESEDGQHCESFRLAVCGVDLIATE